MTSMFGDSSTRDVLPELFRDNGARFPSLRLLLPLNAAS